MLHTATSSSAPGVADYSIRAAAWGTSPRSVAQRAAVRARARVIREHQAEVGVAGIARAQLMAMHPMSWLPRSARGARCHLVALAALSPVLALASAHALTQPEAVAPDGFEARAGASGLAGSAQGGSGAAGSGWDGLGGGGSGGRAGSSGRDGARPLDDTPQDLSATSVAQQQHSTTLRRGVQMENGSGPAPSDQAGSLTVQAPTAGLMVTTNGSCGGEANQVGVARNPRDQAP